MKVAVATPTLTEPFAAYAESVRASEPVIREAGHELLLIIERGNPYISAARATMARKAMDGQADAIVFIDHDIEFRPADLLALIEAPGDVVAGTYRFKKADEEYMGDWLRDGQGRPIGKMAGDLAMIRSDRVPAGFLKVTKEAIDHFMRGYPGLCYGPAYAPSVDLFNHGAHEGVWWGEDYAFARRWTALGHDLWMLPELQLTHHAADGTAYPGDLHEYLQRQAGGAKDPARQQSAA